MTRRIKICWIILTFSIRITMDKNCSGIVINVKSEYIVERIWKQKSYEPKLSVKIHMSRKKQSA